MSSSNAALIWTRGDTGQSIRWYVRYAGQPVDLTDATLVQLVLKQGTGAPTLVTVTPDNAAGGTGLWSPSSTQVGTLGTIKVKLKVTFEGGGVKHFPDDESFVLKIVENLEET